MAVSPARPTIVLNRYEAYLRALLFCAALLPALLLALRWWRNDLGINPFATVSHSLGHVALIFLLATLSITPVRRWLRFFCATLHLSDGKRLSDWNFLIRCRRQLGLHGFFYATLHMLAYLELEALWEWDYLREDLAEKNYLMLGVAAWFCCLLLALTSPKVVIRHLHHWWRRLHRLMYVLSILAVMHFAGAAKAGNDWPLLCALITGVLLLHRLWVRLHTRIRRADDDGLASHRRQEDSSSHSP